MLAQPAHVFAVLAERLDKRETPYAGIFHALVALAGGKLDSEALQEIQEREPDEDHARIDEEWDEAPEIGRASCRERGCQYVSIAVVAVSLKKKRRKYIVRCVRDDRI